MKKNEIILEWQQGMAFKGESDGHTIVVDAKEESGGKNSGPTPKPLMLVALAGCTGMDVVSILKKMKVEPEEFRVKVSGELSEDHPVTYTGMTVTYLFKGKDLPMSKLKKAVSLSEERYCGVMALYKKATELKSEIEII